MPTTITLSDIYARIQPELCEVENEFQKQLDSRIECLRDASHYVINSGGKRIRPALLLLATKLLGDSGPLAITYASVIELIHTASLIHDDIVDEADLRRGRQSINRRWGNDITVLLGDYLYIKSVSLALAQNNQLILDIISRATLHMVEGELIQLAHSGRIDTSEEEHLDVIQRKTGYLFSACCEIGAVLSGASEDERRCLRDYGLDLGMAFQLVDDILDFTATPQALGKPVVNDLKEGRLTLPLIYLLQKHNGEHRRLIEQVLQEKDFRSVSRELIIEMVQQNGTLEQTFELARDFGDRARRHLSIFKESDIKEALLTLPIFILERDR